MALTHSTGFHNFCCIEPDQKLRTHFDPGSRYSYSGAGFSLLQFTIEQGARTKGLGLDVKQLTDAIFVRSMAIGRASPDAVAISSQGLATRRTAGILFRRNGGRLCVAAHL